MIIANFSKGETSKEIYSGLWQWDYGQVLRIQGLELPTATEIHFSLRDKGGEAVTRVGTTKDGVTDVVIPDAMLENNGSAVDYFIYAFVYITDETSGQTEYKISMKVKSRPKPEAYDSPEDAELFREAIATVNDAADRAETAEKEAEGWAHGREDMSEKAEDNAMYYAGEAAKDAEQTATDRKEVERLVESVSGIDEDVELVRGYKEAAEKAAEGAATSAQASEESRKSSETAKRAAKTAQAKAEEAAGKTAEDREAVERAKTDVEGMKSQVTEHKTSIEQTVSDFGLTAQQVVMAVNNAGQTQTERVQGAGNTAVQDIQTAKEQAVQNVETAGTQQVQAVQTEGTTQIGAVQQKGQEVLDSIPEDFSIQMAGKLDKNQGEENSGKVLVVGEDGTVTPGETPLKVDSTLTQSGQAADAKATGDTITALAIKNQASGEVPIIVTDSAEYPIQDLGMEGWTEQQSTTGAQLFKPSQAKYEVSGVTFEFNNGSVTAHGKAENFISTSGMFDMVIPIHEATYFISSDEMKFEAWVIDSSGADRFYQNKAFTLDGTEQSCRVYFSLDQGQTINGIAKAMLNSGSEALPWEPYTGGQPSPSPDYPQEIINAGKYNEETQKWEYEVNLSGVNLIDYNSLKENTAFNQNGIIVNNIGYISTKKIPVSPNTEYTISIENNNFAIIWLEFDENNLLSRNAGIPLGTTRKTSNNTKYIGLTFYNNLTLKDVENIMFNEGSEALPYEPYRPPQTVLLQSDRPLTKWDRLEKRDGQWGWVFKSNVITLNGNEDERWSPYSEKFDDVNIFIYSSSADKELGENNLVCDKLTLSDKSAWVTDKPYVFGGHGAYSYIYVNVPSSIAPDLSSFKQWISENLLRIWYETKTETFVPLTEYEQSALEALHTNYPTTVLMNDQGCVMSLEYVADTKNYIDRKIQESIQQSIAGNLLSTNSNQSLSAPMGAQLNLRIEALEAKIE
ncbi:MAG: hypothetical protein KH330_04200 [Clostridiales bacterium]|nr:hypothetical protein [Clostridiales bacterium]